MDKKEGSAMKLITFSCQWLIILSSLLAAINVSFRPALLKPIAAGSPKKGIGRIAQAAGHWFAFLATLTGTFVPLLAFFASCIAIVSSIPLAVNAVRLKTPRAWALPFILVIPSVVVAAAIPLGLKVLALPKADILPYHPVPSRVIKTYDEGLWFEGIAAGEDGTLYLSGNRGLDFSRDDYYHHAQGELIVRRSNGSERVLFRAPRGLSFGVPVLAQDNSIYLSSHGDTSFIWHIDTSGKAQHFARLPETSWPNGLDIGPDGMIYTADSFLGVIWKINPVSGNVEVVIRDPSLLARPFIALAPGANGVHFKGRELQVTVSDRTTVISYDLDNGGHFSRGTVIARGIPGDDFAVSRDGSLFITTHPYNTVVQVSPGGGRKIIATEAQNITGATAAVFGKTKQDSNALYIITDGGAFNGGPKTRGKLVALNPYSSK